MNREWPKGPTEPVIQNLSKSEISTSPIQPGAQERPAITHEERERIERELVALGNLMGDSKLWWQLDGTLSASLYLKSQGSDYIGAHSDVDISVLRSELPELEEYLKRHEYGLFLISRMGDQRTFRRIGHEAFKGRFLENVREAPYIAAMRPDGTIRADAELVRAQVAIVDTDSKGNPSERGVSYPKEWLRGKDIDLNGTHLVLSHPARYLFFKLWHARGYDEADIHTIAKMNLLSKEELDALEKIVLSKMKDPEWWKENKHFKISQEELLSRIATLREFQTSKD
jgi:hypothetical protein